MRRRLYPIPDKSRVSWCFLVLKTTNTPQNLEICGWELVMANSHRIVKNTESSIQTEWEEAEVLSELGTHLGEFQHENTELYTFKTESLELLRARLLKSDLPSPSLRGYRYLAIQDLLESFGPWWPIVLEHANITTSVPDISLEEVPTELALSAEDLWMIRQCIGPLVPASTLSGELL